MAGSSGLTFELKGQQFIIKHNYSVKKPKAKKKKKKSAKQTSVLPIVFTSVKISLLLEI